MHKCDNCRRQFQWQQLQPIDNIGERIEPGGTVPSGQCPECQCLCYPWGLKRRVKVRLIVRIVVKGGVAEIKSCPKMVTVIIEGQD